MQTADTAIGLDTKRMINDDIFIKVDRSGENFPKCTMFLDGKMPRDQHLNNI